MQREEKKKQIRPNIKNIVKQNALIAWNQTIKKSKSIVNIFYCGNLEQNFKCNNNSNIKTIYLYKCI